MIGFELQIVKRKFWSLETNLKKMVLKLIKDIGKKICDLIGGKKTSYLL